jgi:endogenous inhibitor of DNA gyrase (YacG/DUF329 family)
MVEIQCLQCQKNFLARKWHVEHRRKRYCSKACTNTARRNRVFVHCPTCEKPFWVTPARLTRGYQKFCSRDCSNAGRKLTPAILLARYTKKGSGDECWLWIGEIDKKSGYGRIRVQGKLWMAHKLSYVTTNGPLSEGLIVRHTCDVRPCVRPSHLVKGTHKQNIHDMYERGRQVIVRGSQHGMSKLTERMVEEIRVIKDIFTATIVASAYGTSENTIRRVWRGFNWNRAIS